MSRDGGDTSGRRVRGEQSDSRSYLEKEIDKLDDARPNLKPELEKTKYIPQEIPETETPGQKKDRIATDKKLREKHNKAWRDQNNKIKLFNKETQAAFDNERAHKLDKLRKDAYDRKVAWEAKTPKQQERARKKSIAKGVKTKARNKRIKARQKRWAETKKNLFKKTPPKKLSKQIYRANGIDTKTQAEYDAEVKKQKKLPKADRKYVNHPNAKANSARNKEIKAAANRGPVGKTVDVVKKAPKIPGAVVKAIKPIAKVVSKTLGVPGFDLALATVSERKQNIPSNPTREDFITVRDRDGVGAALWNTLADYGEEVFDPRTNDSYNPLNWDLFSDQAMHAAQDAGIGAANTTKDLWGAVTGDNTRQRLANIVARSIPEKIREENNLPGPDESAGNYLGYMADPKNQADIQRMADELIGEGALSDKAVELLKLPQAEREALVIKERDAEMAAALKYAPILEQKLFEVMGVHGDDDLQKGMMKDLRKTYREGIAARDKQRNENADFSLFKYGDERKGDIGPFAGPEIISDAESMQKMQADLLRRMQYYNKIHMPSELFGSRPGSQASGVLNGPGYEIENNPDNMAAAYYRLASPESGNKYHLGGKKEAFGQMIRSENNPPMALNDDLIYKSISKDEAGRVEPQNMLEQSANVSPLQYREDGFGQDLSMQPLPGERLNAAFDATNPQGGPRVNPLMDAFYSNSRDIEQARAPAIDEPPALPSNAPAVGQSEIARQAGFGIPPEMKIGDGASLKDYYNMGLKEGTMEADFAPVPTSASTPVKSTPSKGSPPSKSLPGRSIRTEAAHARAEALVAMQHRADAEVMAKQKTKDAYYENRLNPLGAGSGYENLQRGYYNR